MPNLNYGQEGLVYVSNENVTEDVTKNVTERQKKLLALTKLNPTISQDDMAFKLGVTRRTITRDIDDLKGKGLIDRESTHIDDEFIRTFHLIRPHVSPKTS